MAQPNQPSNEITPEQALEKLIAEAGLFHEAKAILEQWLRRRGIYFAQGRQSWYVAVEHDLWVGQRMKKETFTTFGQMLSFALNEVDRKDASAGTKNAEVDADKREGAANA